MRQEYLFTLEGALEANVNGKLYDWTQDFLRSEGGNEKLADIVVEKPASIQLIEFPLSRLKRIMGPEENMKFPEDKEVWGQRVNKLEEKIKEGIKLPPLIVTDFWDDLAISDGSHRYEALLRSGLDKYWTIFFFGKSKSRELLRTED